jgi:hypothetical protein
MHTHFLNVNHRRVGVTTGGNMARIRALNMATISLVE